MLIEEKSGEKGAQKRREGIDEGLRRGAWTGEIKEMFKEGSSSASNRNQKE